MSINWTCGCGSNRWALEFEEDYPEIIIMHCTQCNYVDTLSYVDNN